MTSPTAFEIALEARDPSGRCARSYHIEAGPDLLGDWLVVVTYSRIGTPGRPLYFSASDEAGARRIIKHRLQRRGTAPKRIGIGYLVRNVFDASGWLDVTFRFSESSPRTDARDARLKGKVPTLKYDVHPVLPKTPERLSLCDKHPR